MYLNRESNKKSCEKAHVLFHNYEILVLKSSGKFQNDGTQLI